MFDGVDANWVRTPAAVRFRAAVVADAATPRALFADAGFPLAVPPFVATAPSRQLSAAVVDAAVGQVAEVGTFLWETTGVWWVVASRFDDTILAARVPVTLCVRGSSLPVD